MAPRKPSASAEPEKPDTEQEEPEREPHCLWCDRDFSSIQSCPRCGYFTPVE